LCLYCPGQAELRSNPSEASVVTFHELHHKVPKTARVEMEKANKAMTNTAAMMRSNT
jgi:hypothetical protein